MQVLLLAGGLATRLRPLTEKIPKALLNVNDKPFIHYQLNYLKTQGINNVILCLSYLAEQIIDYLGDGSKYNLKINYSFDGKNLLGTGGAIKNAYNLLEDKFFIMYGDSYLPVNFKKIYQKFYENNSIALMTIYENKNQLDKSNVIFKSNKIILYDKNNYVDSMKYIDYGLTLIKKSVFNKIKTEKFDLSTIFNELSTEGMLDNFIIYDRFYEIGSFSGIKDFTKYVKKNNL